MPSELLASSALQNLEMLKMTIADFSDADMLVRPCLGANHAAWQLGHLIVSETNMVNLVSPGAMPALPAGFADKFTPKTASIDDPAFFPRKAELLDALSRTRAASAKWIGSQSETDLAKPGPEQMRGFAPTVGHFCVLVPGHTTMHVGQLQVIRRKLGKKILF